MNTVCLKNLFALFFYLQSTAQSNQNYIDSENLTEEIIENIPENTTTENFWENDNSIVPFWINGNSEESEKLSPNKIIQNNSSHSSKFPFEGLVKQPKLVPFSDK